MSLFAGWNRGLLESPEQPVLFFLRGGQWRWWSYRDLKVSADCVARVAEAEELPSRVCFPSIKPRWTLAMDIGLRATGRFPVSVVETVLPQENSEWDLWQPDSLTTLPPKGAKLSGPLLSSHAQVDLVTEGQWHRVEPAGLMEGVLSLDHSLPRLGKERPIVLMAGELCCEAQRVCLEWVAWYGAILVWLHNEDELSWAVTWARPHWVLGSGRAAEVAARFADEHGGSSAWSRRFRRLHTWVLIDEEAGSSSGVENPESEALEIWNQRGVRVLEFPRMPWRGNLHDVGVE